jgi:NADPH:quinone reductase-like Zn-dependent oxidoreductase
MPAGQALWLTAKNGALRVGPAPDTPPRANEIVVRARAVAVNPFDRYLPSLGGLITPWLKYPAVLGSDVAGEAIAVGSAVTRFKPGDRVVGFAAGSDKGHRAAEGAFQEHVVLQAHMTSPIPDRLSFEAAAVLPLGLSTAASGLFQKDFLALRHPSATSTPSGETVLVWGGSTSVGGNAIQLAAAAGYDVVTTASPHNFDYVKRLGARAAFDYNSRTVAADIVAALQGRTVAGGLAIGVGSTAALLDIVDACDGKPFIAVATPPVTLDAGASGRGGFLGLLPSLMRMGLANAGLAITARRTGIATKFIWGSSLQDNEVGPMIFETFLPQALADGRYVCAPDPLVSGQGLSAIPEALDRLGQGVSARKLVVTL